MEQDETKREDLVCQKCISKEFGAGQTNCEKHGQAQIDWKCQFCCNIALYHCFGTTYFCYPCHEDWNHGRGVTVKDCHGVNCPLGIAHPPANKNVHKGAVYPLGCGICRSEKLDLLKKRTHCQVITEEHVPKAFNVDYRRRQIVDKIDRPLVEIEVPDFIALADEIEAERVRILNITPVPYMNASEKRRVEKAKQKKLMKAERAKIVHKDVIEEEPVAQAAAVAAAKPAQRKYKVVESAAIRVKAARRRF